MIRPFLAVATFLTLLAAPLPGLAQSQFSPKVTINGSVISNYEFQQRSRMLTLFQGGRTEGVAEAALTGLIEDRLRQDAARAGGITLTPDQLSEGLAEFAGRANLSTEEFTTALAQGGVDAATFRDFVSAGLLWRFVVRERFGPRISVSEVEIDRAIAGGAGAVQGRLLLSEIILPAVGAQEAGARALANTIRRDATTEAAFAAAARQHSSAATAARGGQLDPIELTNLPEAVIETVRRLAPGEVSPVVQIPGALAIFFLRGTQEPATNAPTGQTVEYARYLVPANRDPATEAARVAAAVDTCAEMNTVARGLPEGALVVEKRPAAQLPADLALDINRLDPGETVLVQRAGAAMVLMLCSRVPTAPAPPDRAAVRNGLLNQRLASMADIYLEELRQAAIISEP